MKKSKPQQLTFAFADNPQGVAKENPMDESVEESKAALIANDSQRSVMTLPAPAIDTSRLLERVSSEGNLRLAFECVESNKGAPGIDGVTVEEVKREAARLTRKLSEALLSESYVPGDIRRVWIPKPNGGKRGLGIPTVIDRWVQMAVLLVLEPIFDPTFHSSSHGFRPGRGAQTAVAEAAGYVGRDDMRYTVDIDLESFFDRVHHQRLLDRLAQRIADRRVIRLIRLMLKAKVVFPDGVRVTQREGTPQGGPLSPLLSNIVLDELDQELERRGLRFVRYADDCNVYVKSERAGQRVMASLTRFIEGRLRLKVNQTKSAVSRSGRRHFLGFRIGAVEGRVFVRLSDRSIERLRQKVRDLTPRNWGSSPDLAIRRLNAYLRGWMAYFRLCTGGDRRLLGFTDAHIRRRLRAIIVKQKSKRPRFLFRFLTQAGSSRPSAVRSAYSRRGPWWKSASGALHTAVPKARFADLVSLEELWKVKRTDWKPYWGSSS